MRKSPADAGGHSGYFGSSSKRLILIAVIAVAALVFSGIVMMNGSEDSNADNWSPANSVTVLGTEVPGDNEPIRLGVHASETVQYDRTTGILILRLYGTYHELSKGVTVYNEVIYASIYADGDLKIVRDGGHKDEDLVFAADTYQGSDMDTFPPKKICALLVLGDL